MNLKTISTSHPLYTVWDALAQYGSDMELIEDDLLGDRVEIQISRNTYVSVKTEEDARHGAPSVVDTVNMAPAYAVILSTTSDHPAEPSFRKISAVLADPGSAAAHVLYIMGALPVPWHEDEDA